MDSRPQNPRSVVEIAISLNIDRDSIARFGGERGAYRGRRAISHPAGSLPSQVAVRLVVIPELCVMAARKIAGRGQAPVFVHDQRPELGINARGADRTAIPSSLLSLQGLGKCGHMGFVVGLRVFGDALLNARLL